MAVTPAEAEAWHAARAVDTDAPPHPHGFSVAAEAGRPPSMIRACPRPIKLTARVACKSMNRAQEQKHLAQANGHIAELKVQIVRQRVIVKYALDTDQPSEMAESMLPCARREPRRIREASRTGSRSVEAPTVRIRGSSKPQRAV